MTLPSALTTTVPWGGSVAVTVIGRSPSPVSLARTAMITGVPTPAEAASATATGTSSTGVTVTVTVAVAS